MNQPFRPDAALPGPSLRLGHRCAHNPSLFAQSGLSPAQLFFDAPELVPHRGKPWLYSHLKKRHGLDVDARPPEPAGVPFDISHALLGRHAVLCGASGSGKTRLALHLLREHLRAGGSAVVVDFKAETIQQALAVAGEAGLEPAQITLVWPQEAQQGVAGWNPLGGEASDVRHAVRQFVDLVRASADVAGSRMWDVLTNAATVIAGQGLSLLELLRFLQSPEYRAGVLAQALGTPAAQQFEEAHRYFEWEFAALSRNEQASYTAPVLNKIRALVDIPYLKALLCANADTLDLPGLWQRPRLLAVHLDEYALGQDGVRLLSGLLAHSLFQTARRSPGSLPVCLCLDEMGMQERFLGGAICDILAMARSYNLRLLAACQHLGQLSDALRAALLASTALRVFFRLSPDDARWVAASLATGLGSQPARVSLSLAAHSASVLPEMEAVGHAIVDHEDRPLCVSPVAWNEFSRVQAATQASEREEPRRLIALDVLMRLSFIPRLYVRVPGQTQTQEIAAYLAGLPANAYHFTGPAPLRLVIRFPRPRVTVLDRKSEEERTRDLARVLMDLPVQEAVARTDTGTMAHLRIVSVPFPTYLPDAYDYLTGGQSEAEIAATNEERSEEIARLAGFTPAPTPPRETPTRSAESTRSAERAALVPAMQAVSLPKRRKTGRSRVEEPYAEPSQAYTAAGVSNAPAEPRGHTGPKPSAQETRLTQEAGRAEYAASSLLWDTPLPPEPEVADDGSL